MFDSIRSKKSLPKVRKVKKFSVKKLTVFVILTALVSFEVGLVCGFYLRTNDEISSAAIHMKKVDEYTKILPFIKTAQAKNQKDELIFGASNSNGVQSDNILRVLNIPILMYHHVSDKIDKSDQWAAGLTVTSQDFEQQIKYIAENGFNTISLFDLYKALNEGKPLPQKAVILTFDDGYSDNYNAFQILKKYHKTGAFFIITSLIDAQNYLSSAQLKEMSDAGMEIESHTESHLDLTGADVARLTVEAALSKKKLEKIIQKSVYFTAYPLGLYNQRAISVFKSQGYLLALTTYPGRWQDNKKSFELLRLAVKPGINLREFSRLLSP